MFTFLIITYNHEKYIVEHLESIKYQIINYGREKKIELIISDDSSNDETIYLIKKWVEFNFELFDNVQILTSKNNQGVVKNFLRGINAISSDKFKVLSGDDMYFIYDIFHAIEKKDIVFSSPIVISKNGVDSSTTMKVMYNCSKIMSKSFQQVSRDMEKGNNYINIPSAFYSLEIIKDLKLQNYISKYTWIEDRPLWYYLFVINNKKLDIKYKTKPYVMYRYDSGISHKVGKKYDKFKEELKLMKKDMGIRNLPKYINPEKYKRQFYFLKKQYIDSVFNKEFKNIYNTYLENISLGEEYLQDIKLLAKEFYEKINKGYD